MQRERGFSLVEVLVAAGCALLVLVGLAQLATVWMGSAARADRRVQAVAAVDQFLERWSRESAGAWSIFVPSNDVLGRANADGHEFDLYTQDSLGRGAFTAYRYDAAAQTLTRYVYAAPGSAPNIDGDVAHDITAFAARSVRAASVAQPTAPGFDPLFAADTITDVSYDLGLGSTVTGGNALLLAHISADGADDTVALASGTAPTQITVVIPYTPAPTPTP
ncbi:MAG: prepilin-type N-terminal cleavage/methylation domain-containing protein [Vulcanimicrobiaceae bacterium]